MSDSSTSGNLAPQADEPREPSEMLGQSTDGAEAPPMWMWMAIFIALFAGVYFLGANLGNISADPWPEAGGIPAVAVAETPSIDGAAIYANRCITCHQTGGTGVPGVFPPLTGSEWVTGDPDIMIRIVLSGLQGPIDVAGSTYNGVMPPLASQMPDDEIAAAVSHVRSSFGSAASAVTSADVARIRSEGRATPWTVDELSGMSSSAPPSTPPPTPSTPAPAAATPVVAASTGGGGSGSALFTQFACNTCHSVDAPTAMVGPSLFDVGNRLSKAEIYEAIVDPDATITDGYGAGVMSAMVGTMNFSTAELNRLVDYLASLKG